jgi:hypothetical protein
MAGENGAFFWKAAGLMNQGWNLALCGRTSTAIKVLEEGISAWRSTKSTLWLPLYLTQLAHAEAELNQFDRACSHINEAMTIVEKKERSGARPRSSASPGKSR